MTTQPNATRNRPAVRPRRTHSGAAVLEMSMVLVMLVTLTTGAVEFGDAYFKKNTLQGAAREGARRAIISNATVADATAAARAVLTAAGIATTVGTIEVRREDTKTVVGDLSLVPTGTAIQVRVYATWQSIGISPMGLLDRTKVINGVAIMRKEG
jgi:Flp pilus assembly protein TadG